MSVYTTDDEKRGRPTKILFPNIKVLVTNTTGSISAPLVHFIMINIVIINIVRFQVFIKGDVRPFLWVSATFYQDITLRTFSELWRTSYTLVLLGGRKKGAGVRKEKRKENLQF